MNEGHTYEEILEVLKETEKRAIHRSPLTCRELFKKQAEEAGYGTQKCRLYYMKYEPSERGLRCTIFNSYFDESGKSIGRDEYYSLP